MADGPPIVVDPRRASALRDALVANARMLAPDWAGVAQEGDFGRGLLEIAARLAEHATSGLDKTPLRDKLAFLESLDVATPAPQSATAPIVFTLAEKRETKVSAPARVQITAKSGKDELTFETRDAIDITPARIASVIVADPATDRIERAPVYVTRSVDTVPPATRYQLLSAAEADSKTIQLVQGVGIVPDDLLRIADGVYRVEKAKDGIVQLKDKLDQSAPAKAPIDKLIALESFALRNLQDHAVYFGHKEMLKLDGPAEITLVFDPPTLPAVLAGLNVDYEIWAAPEPQGDEPGWRALDLIGAGPAGLVLGKNWQGDIDELEFPAGKSRWMRIRLRDPIEGACGPPTGAVSVELKVQSTLPQKAEAEGSDTITAAFYNSQPLPIAASFFPFGPEPQRFDMFSLSAPEALSKRRARVTLDVKMVGADLQAMTYVASEIPHADISSIASANTTSNAPVDPGHVYGVSKSGRMQAVYFDRGTPSWRQLGAAPSPAGGADGELRFDPSMSLAVVRISSSLELVFVRDAAKRLLCGRVEKPGNADWTLKYWTEVEPPAEAGPPPKKEDLLALCLLPPAAGSADYRLVAAYKSGFYALTIYAGNGAVGPLAPIGSNPAVTAPIALTLAQASPGKAVLALIDDQGVIRRGDLLAGQALYWQTLDDSPPADATIQPAAFLDDGGKLVVVAAHRKLKPGDGILLVAHENGDKWDSLDVGVDRAAGIGDVTSISGWRKANDFPPLIFVSGDKGLLTWWVSKPTEPPFLRSEVRLLPAGVVGVSDYALVRPPSGGSLAPQLLLNAGGEQLLSGPLVAETVVELRDVLRHEPREEPALDDPRTKPTLFMLHSKMTPVPIDDGPWIDIPSNLSVHAAPAGLAEGDHYYLLNEIAGHFDGAAVPDEQGQLKLAADDHVTAKRDFLLIAGAYYKVTDVTPEGIAKLGVALNGPTTYRVFKRRDECYFGEKDRATLALGAGGSQATVELEFTASASPVLQRVNGYSSSDDTSYFSLGTKWDAQPKPAANDPEPNLPVVMWGEIGVGLLEPVMLPRNADNPALSWEYHNGEGWRRLDKKWAFADSTGNFAGSGKIDFTVPDDINPTEIAGKEDFWIRARLTGGDFGRVSYVVTNDPATGNPKRTSITVDRSLLNAPEIFSIEASYVLDAAVRPELVVADNNLAAIDQTQAALEKGAVFNLFESVAQHVGDTDGGTRALYIGLDKRPDVQALRFYADIFDHDEGWRELKAEALTAAGWQPLGVDDETAGLARPGMIQPHLVPPPEQLPLFGRNGWWLRLRPKKDAATWAFDLRGLFVNAVTAEHARTVTKELLGSSLGDPDQRYVLSQKPVLPKTLDLRVLESLGEEEREAIEAASGADSIAEDAGQRGQWVRWREVTSFVDADGDARVFRLDPASGAVQFGNGRSGKTPPAGRDSIRAFTYQWGGGSTGNVPARAIAKLSSALESVELAMNPVDAGGGADAPPTDRLAVTTPALLRHAGRALAPSDVEAMAVESAPDVVRARCLPRRGCSIEIVVAIRDTGQRAPIPSRERREGIARNIRDAGWGALASDAVTVRSPHYVRARVDVELIASSAEAAAGVESAVRATLTQFLHPVEGGADGLGWPFGRRIWPSDLQSTIAGVAGLDRLVAIDIAATVSGESLTAMPLDGLICVEDADLIITVRSPEAGQ